MSYGMTFQGAYTFATQGGLDAALADVAEIVRDEDVAFREIWAMGGDLTIDGLTIKVDVDGSFPPDFYEAYETIVETLAERAQTGSVTSTMEGTDEVGEYPAGEDW